MREREGKEPEAEGALWAGFEGNSHLSLFHDRQSFFITCHHPHIPSSPYDRLQYAGLGLHPVPYHLSSLLSFNGRQVGILRQLRERARSPPLFFLRH